MRIMTDMRAALLLCLIGALALGCSGTEGPKKQIEEGPKTSAEAKQPDPKRVLALNSGTGSVGIGDDVSAAKNAFPVPPGATGFDRAMNFAIAADEGWAWTDLKSGRTFEAALKGGKVIGLVLQELGESPEPSAGEALSAMLGRPTGQAKGKTCEALAWEAGENARIVVLLKTDDSLLGKGKLTMIGRKADLAMLNYRSDDLETVVRIMDAGAEQLGKLKQ